MWILTNEHQRLEIASRQQLRNPDVQLELEIAHKNGWVFRCECCSARSIMIPFWDPDDRGYNLRRESIEDLHGESCPARSLGCTFAPVHRGNVVFCPSVFLPPRLAHGVATPQGNGNGTGHTNGSPEYGDFTRLVHGALMDATLRAIAEANHGLGFRDLNLANPNSHPIFRGLADYLRLRKMSDGTTAAHAAAMLGRNIYWALVHDELAVNLRRLQREAGKIEFRPPRCWDSYGIVQRPPLFTVDRQTGVGGKTMAYSNMISPPYLAVMSATPKGEVDQLTVIPAVNPNGWLWGKESDAEGRFLEILAAHGAVVVKLVVDWDLRLLGPSLWPFPVTDEGDLPHRVDAIVFFHGRVWIFEYAGSDSKRYNELVDRRVETLQSFFRHHAEAVSVRKVRKADLDETPPPFIVEMLA